MACVLHLLDSADLDHLRLHNLETREDKLRGDTGEMNKCEWFQNLLEMPMTDEINSKRWVKERKCLNLEEKTCRYYGTQAALSPTLISIWLHAGGRQVYFRASHAAQLYLQRGWTKD